MTLEPKGGGRLEQALRAGAFAITAETTPPLSADPERAVARVAPLKGLVHAVNVTDGAGARAHLSSLAVAHFMRAAHGLEAVLQFTARDRNKLALARDLIGAAAFAIPNILCLSGDPIDIGDEPEATAVNDVDSTGLVKLAAGLRDDGKLASGRAIEPPPRYLIGVADAPLDPPADWRPASLLGKIAAGADFAQTQFCFDTAVLARYVARLHECGVPTSFPLLVGLSPLASARQGRWMRENLFGSIIPDRYIARLEAAAEPPAEGRRVCVELMHELQAMPGIAGVHLMGPGAEARIAQTIEESGLVA